MKIIPGIEITNWSTLATLLKYEYISVFNFGNEEKYALTDYGLKFAGSIYELRAAEAESLEKIPKTLASITHLVAPAEDAEDNNSRTRFTLFEEVRVNQQAPTKPSGFAMEYQQVSSEFKLAREQMSKQRLSDFEEEEKSTKKEIEYLEIDDQPISIQVYEPPKSRQLPKDDVMLEAEEDHCENSLVDETSNMFNSKSQLLSKDTNDSSFIRPFDSDWGCDENTTKTMAEGVNVQLAEAEFKHQVLKSTSI